MSSLLISLSIFHYIFLVLVLWPWGLMYSSIKEIALSFQTLNHDIHVRCIFCSYLTIYKIWYDTLNYRASTTTNLVGSHSNVLDLCDLEMGTSHTELVHIGHKLHRLLQTKVVYQHITIPSSITALSLKRNISKHNFVLLNTILTT